MNLLAIALRGPARWLWVVWSAVLCGGCFGKGESESTFEVVPQEICIDGVPGILAGPFPAQIGTVIASIEWPKSEEVAVTFSVLVPGTPELEFDVGATTVFRPTERRLKNRHEAAIQVYATGVLPAQSWFFVEATVSRSGAADYFPPDVEVVVQSAVCAGAPEPHFTRFEPEVITLSGAGDTAGEIQAEVAWQDEEVIAVDLRADTTATVPPPVEFTIGDVQLDGAGSFRAPFTARPLVPGPATGAFDIVVDVHGATRDASIRQRVEVEIVASGGSDLIVFTNTPSGADSEIWVMDGSLDRAGGSWRQLTDNDREDWDPAWSPDGTQIAFVSNTQGQGGNLDLMVMDFNGVDPTLPPPNVTPLTHFDGFNQLSARDPAWSHVAGERKIAFAVGANGFFDEIWILDLDQPGSDPLRIDAGASTEVEHPVWSQGGAKIVFCNLGTTYLVSADGSSAPTMYGTGEGWSLDWSPDGFVLERYENQLFRLVRTDSDGNSATHLTSGGTHMYDKTPSWSPMSDRIVFVRQFDEASDGRLRIVYVNGDKELGQPDGDNSEPDWGFAPRP